MSKIDDFIREHNVKPHECLYHTNRNVVGAKPGKIRVLVPKTDSIARCEYVCPSCGSSGYVEQPWKRPFFVKCEKCSAKISVPRIRDEAKRQRKLANKK